MWDLVPVAVVSLPRKKTQNVFAEAVRAYLFGLDLACVGIGRSALEVLLRELHEVRCWSKKVSAAYPVSPWARTDLEALRVKARTAGAEEPDGKRGGVKKDSEGVNLFWCAEDLFAASALDEQEAAAAHEIRVAGNAAIHAGIASGPTALATLRHLRTVLGVFG